MERIFAWLLGPKAENQKLLEELINLVISDYIHWRRNYFPKDKTLIRRKDQSELRDEFDKLYDNIFNLLGEMRRNFPFYSPRYIAHMQSETTLPALLGFIMGLLYNPNNVSTESSPVTTDWEIEAGNRVLELIGYRPAPDPSLPKDKYLRELKREFGWAHITSGGTTANLEALWAARNVRYTILAIKDVAIKENVDLIIKLPNGKKYDISEVDDYSLLTIKPNEAIYALSRLVVAMKRKYLESDEEINKKVLKLLRKSERSISKGFGKLFAEFQPVILTSGTSHYSIEKIADVLGVGRDNVIYVDIDENFRMSVKDLYSKLKGVKAENKVPIAVIATIGTTEEGSVDPLHEIVKLREEFEKGGFSFWVHADAAWGGFIKTLLTDGDDEKKVIEKVRRITEDEIELEHENYQKRIRILWGSDKVVLPFLALKRAESVTVDPHKMGYMPYPCGMVAFRNDRVRHFISQEVPYITSTFAVHLPLKHKDLESGKVVINSLGPYILEGSKPGASASALWLQINTIPLTPEGHGELVKNSLLAARLLWEWIVHWDQAERVNGREPEYQFIPLTQYPPDTNIVTFVVKKKISRSIAQMNELTKKVYEEFSIRTELGEFEYSYSQPFFLSKTVFKSPKYPFKALRPFFKRAFPKAELPKLEREYEKEGLFVLRAVVMNPYIYPLKKRGQDLMKEFMRRASEAAERALRRGL
ncbi:hypothetical protein IPA_08385 [Ignicoccus pacificus DSM 13166]|uniref:L-tyrosine decarboxylase C-terminal domain-containing protein n=1 Tax=Ignicoccus pacificus DSM 13166 TaxID=940294 RepID=A0A977KDB5_9CREN|nr:hypothetical protein IPA_08385 [Ignicoccus pacificus DSM 13166]